VLDVGLIFRIGTSDYLVDPLFAFAPMSRYWFDLDAAINEIVSVAESLLLVRQCDHYAMLIVVLSGDY
jgi:hypothetical protein